MLKECSQFDLIKLVWNKFPDLNQKDEGKCSVLIKSKFVASFTLNKRLSYSLEFLDMTSSWPKWKQYPTGLEKTQWEEIDGVHLIEERNQIIVFGGKHNKSTAVLSFEEKSINITGIEFNTTGVPKHNKEKLIIRRSGNKLVVYEPNTVKSIYTYDIETRQCQEFMKF